MDAKKTAEALHPLERKLLASLRKYTKLEYLTKDSGMQEVEAMRALQWLQNKGALTIKKTETETIALDENGRKYLKEGLPERRLLKEVAQAPKKTQDIKSIGKDEIGASIGALKKKAAITAENGAITITQQGKALLEKEMLEEKFLKLGFPIETSKLKDEEKYALDALKTRKQIIRIEKKKETSAELTELGKELLKTKTDENTIDSLTPEMIKTGGWKNKKFRRYDVTINVPQIDCGKKHFVKQALESAKQIWLDMGFKEMTGTKVQTSFWNFDALFTAQDHPVREMQDTFFIKTAPLGKLPDQKLVEKVKNAHEKGAGGSTGWGGKWEEEAAKRNVMRTHTTCLSSKTTHSLKKEDLPAKFFALGKCFRNEAVDWSHLFEFNQTEGIVVDKNATFANLLGYLKQFFKKMGFENARFKPSFFPYTEPSVEIEVFHPVHKKWLELGGAGMFRPEVTIPLLGEETPVLAWGPGFDRIILEYYKITDIRDLYKNDLRQLRKMKAWNRS